MGTAITGTQMRTLKASVVTELPDKGVSNKIYYVPNGTTGDNKYDEYIWIKDAEHPNGYFEKVGQKDIDLNINNLPIKENISGTEKIVISDNDENKGIEISKVKEYATEGVATKEDLNGFIPNLRKSTHADQYSSYFPYCFFNDELSKISLEDLCKQIWGNEYDLDFKCGKAFLKAYYGETESSPVYIPEGIKFFNKREWTDIEANPFNQHLIFNSDIECHDIYTSSLHSNKDGVTTSSVFNAVGSITEVYNKTEIDENLKTKVDKVDGKNLSTNDFTNELKQTLEDLNSWNYIGILSSWNGIAKLTTESTEADILNALTITPLRGNKINTKTELFKVLDQCAINKKFLKESSTNAHVFVEHIGSCYVIQILGNKAAVLNGNLVGTPVLRHITISANSNETLTVRKNPFEIKLEDINKKVANLETQVKDLTDRITALETK